MRQVLHHALFVVTVSFSNYFLSKIVLLSFAFLFCQCSDSVLISILWPFISYTNRNGCSWKKEFVGDLHLGKQEGAVTCWALCHLRSSSNLRGTEFCVYSSANHVVCSAEICAIAGCHGACRGPSLAQHLHGRKGTQCNYYSLGCVFRAGIYFVCRIIKFVAEILVHHPLSHPLPILKHAF